MISEPEHESELRARLRELRAPNEDEAEGRSWDVVRSAFAERSPAPAPSRVRRAALASLAAGALLGVGLSPAGAKVGDVVSDVVGIGEDDARPALRSLPAGGALLVASEQGTWVVHGDGTKRLLGGYEEAAWSPNGFYIAAAAGRELTALEPDGDVRWTYTAPGPVSDPRWAGTELDTRIAYRSGGDLRVIAGNGRASTDRLVASDVAPIAPAWRPVEESKIQAGFGAGPYVVTYVTASGSVRSADVERGKRLPVLRDDRRRLTTPPSKPGMDRVISPDGTRFAVAEHAGARDRVIVAAVGEPGPRVLFSAHGRLTAPTWSPDGKWILVGWPAADQWLFINVDRPRRVVAVDNIAEHFDPGGGGDGTFPKVSGWALASP